MDNFIKKWKFFVPYLLYTIIFLIACYDSWWCYMIPTNQFIYSEEKNPVVVFLVQAIGINAFIKLKIFNCAMVIILCELLRKIHTRIWIMVIGGIFLFQLFVLFYLEFGQILYTDGDLLWKFYLEILKNY